jgi:succinoglycan biosynthesis transport protein ExoP
LLIKPISSDFFYIPPPNLETESEIISSEPVAELVREEIAPRGLGSGELLVEPLTDTEVVVVGYVAPDPAFARDAANSFARNYIEYRRAQALSELRGAQRAVQNRVDSTRDKLVQVGEDLREARRRGDPSLAQALEAERGSLIARLGVLQQRYDDIQPERSVRTGGGQLLEPASTPSRPYSPNHLRSGLFGAFFAVLLGIGAAFFLERLDDRFRDRNDVQRVLRAPVLATIPRFRHPKKGLVDIIVRTGPGDIASEAYRTLVTNVQFTSAQRGCRSLLVTSARAGEGKTVTCANLAVTLAQTGHRVVLISADLRRPALEKYFNTNGRAGLSTWLAGEDQDLLALLVDPGIPNLRIIPSGPLPLDPAGLLNSPRLAHLISQLAPQCDYLLLDSPPTLGLADSVILSSSIDGTILIVDAKSSRRSHVVHALEELQRVGGPIIGSVFNNLVESSSAGYGYYYSAHDRAGERVADNGGSSSLSTSR